MLVTQQKYDKLAAEKKKLEEQLVALKNGGSVSAKKLKSIRAAFGDAGKEKGFKTVAAVKSLISSLTKKDERISALKSEVKKLTTANDTLTKQVKGMKGAPAKKTTKPKIKNDPDPDEEEDEFDGEELSEDKSVSAAHELHEIASKAGKGRK